MRKILFAISLTVVLLALITPQLFGQQSDTTEVIKELEQEDNFSQPFHSDRAVGNMYMAETGTFSIPEPKEYYNRPFMGQKYLEIALEYYYEKWESNKSFLYRFINTVAPFIDNQFEFAVYRVYDLPIVERDHPLLDPQLNEKSQNKKLKKER